MEEKRIVTSSRGRAARFGFGRGAALLALVFTIGISSCEFARGVLGIKEE